MRAYTPPSKRRMKQLVFRLCARNAASAPSMSMAAACLSSGGKEWWHDSQERPDMLMAIDDIRAATRGEAHGPHGRITDPTTLAVVAERCVREGMTDRAVWVTLAWRAQQLITKTFEPHLRT
ncbi:unnamed protein product [Vitrella brassicaformis CCMP3155]|uniref:Uncharacterized protein n=1 Tax=Vitrella brassicaformis (strain CCMP3155) TaxID=1169540 RepID=A0A0G4G129_VITBC|nr:unnamed protein product [Vitrella brassicaformis CCMP3155]|eukprot:CEM21691.1 unnamed protein product [Vitrella brassicaformis CCMP3155]